MPNLKLKAVKPIGYVTVRDSGTGAESLLPVYPASAVELGDALRRAIFARAMFLSDVRTRLGLQDTDTLRQMLAGRYSFDLTAALSVLPEPPTY